MAFTRKATAHWSGGLKDGKGKLNAATGIFKDVPYGFKNRFDNEPGTNPEELIAAAHAGCYAMALSGALEKAGHVAESIDVEAAVTLDFIDETPTVTKSHLTLKAKVPGMDKDAFLEAANGAKAGCPISRLLKAEISLNAELI
jgi:osmotically inducible protein OsmC